MHDYKGRKKKLLLPFFCLTKKRVQTCFDFGSVSIDWNSDKTLQRKKSISRTIGTLFQIFQKKICFVSKSLFLHHTKVGKAELKLFSPTKLLSKWNFCFSLREFCIWLSHIVEKHRLMLSTGYCYHFCVSTELYEKICNLIYLKAISEINHFV